VIAGWATFERLQLPATQKPDKSGTAALDVATVRTSTRCDKKNVGGVPGDFTPGHDVYKVLVIEPTGNNSFRRIDIDMVFDRIIKDFEQEEPSTFHLVRVLSRRNLVSGEAGRMKPQ
jgi:hypothetical protein